MAKKILLAELRLAADEFMRIGGDGRSPLSCRGNSQRCSAVNQRTSSGAGFRMARRGRTAFRAPGSRRASAAPDHLRRAAAIIRNRHALASVGMTPEMVQIAPESLLHTGLGDASLRCSATSLWYQLPCVNFIRADFPTRKCRSRLFPFLAPDWAVTAASSDGSYRWLHPLLGSHTRDSGLFGFGSKSEDCASL